MILDTVIHDVAHLVTEEHEEPVQESAVDTVQTSRLVITLEEHSSSRMAQHDDENTSET